jgi:hypothetical protein
MPQSGKAGTIGLPESFTGSTNSDAVRRWQKSPDGALTTNQRNSMIDEAKYYSERVESPKSDLRSQTEANLQEITTTLEVLVVHEDMPTGLRAKQVLDRLGRGPAINLHFVVKLWTFKSLHDPLLHQHAVNDANDVSILFLSVHGHLELPVHVCELVDQWVAGRQDPGAVVVSLDESFRDSPVASAILDDLRSKVLFGGVDLFPHFGTTPQAAWNWGSQGLTVEAGARQTSLMAPFLRETMGCNG